jgi:hypothetical protein
MPPSGIAAVGTDARPQGSSIGGHGNRFPRNLVPATGVLVISPGTASTSLPSSSCEVGGDQRAAPLAGLDDDGRAREAGDDPGAHRKAPFEAGSGITSRSPTPDHTETTPA